MIPGVSFFCRVYTKERISEEVSWFLLLSAALLMHRGLAEALGQEQWSVRASLRLAGALALAAAACHKSYAVRLALLVFLTGLYGYAWLGDLRVTLGVLCLVSAHYLYKMLKYRNTYEVHA